MRFKTVYTEITNKCNLNCRTCYNRSGLNKTTREISVAEIEYILKTCSEYGANRFLFSGGEPSLHSHFHELLALIDEYPKFSYGFVTNGTVHDEAWIDFLNSHDNITLQISLDGASEETNKLTRGCGNFDRALEFIKKLRLPSQKPLLKMVVSKNNLHDVENYYRFAVTLGCIPEFAFIYRSGNGADEWEKKALSPQQKLSVLRTVRKLNEEYSIEAYLPMCTVRCPFSSGNDTISVCIKTNGMIQPCQTLYSDEYSIGNIFELNEKEMQIRVDSLISTAKQRLLTNYGCEKCLLRSGCGKGCMAEAVNNFGNPLADDGNCLLRKLQFLEIYAKEQTDGSLRKDERK